MPCRHHQQDRRLVAILEQQVDDFERGRVYPMHVLNQHQQGPHFGQPDEVLGQELVVGHRDRVARQAREVMLQRLFGQLELHRRRHLQRCIAAQQVQPQQRGDQAALTRTVDTRDGQLGFKLVELLVAAVHARQPGSGGQVLHKRLQRAVDVKRRTLQSQQGVALRRQGVVQGGHEARLADAGVADDQRPAGAPAGSSQPLPVQGGKFALATHHRQAGVTTAPGRTTVERARAAQQADQNKRIEALELMLTKVVEVELRAGNLTGYRRHPDHAGRHRSLHPCRQIGRQASDRHGLTRTDSHHAGGNPDPQRQGPARIDFNAWHLGRQCKRGVQGADRVVLVGRRVAKVDVHTVTHDARDVATKSRGNSSDHFVIAPQRVQQVIRIDLLGQFGRAHQVAEQHRHLPTRCARRGLGGRQWRTAQRTKAASWRNLSLATWTTHPALRPQCLQPGQGRGLQGLTAGFGTGDTKAHIRVLAPDLIRADLQCLLGNPLSACRRHNLAFSQQP